MSEIKKLWNEIFELDSDTKKELIMTLFDEIETQDKLYVLKELSDYSTTML